MTRVSAIVAPLLALFAALVLIATPSSVQGAPASPQVIKAAIGVRVLNEAGKPVRNADVLLLTADGKKLALRHTDLLGRALFAPVKPGDYIVRAAKVGVGKGQEKVTAEDGKLAKVTVHLKKQ